MMKLQLLLSICLVVLPLMIKVAAAGVGGCDCNDDDDDTDDMDLLQKCGDLASEGETAVCDQCPVKRVTINSTPPPPKAVDYRLPKTILPVHYNLRLQPYMYTGDPKNFLLKGHVSIRVRCTENTNIITLHKKMLTIDNSRISIIGLNQSTPSPRVVGTTEDDETDFYVIRLDRILQAGREYVLTMSYTAPLKPGVAGMYLVKYKENNQTIYMAATQFEPIRARRVLPCFDEPGIKATFKTTLVRKQDLISLSNMPVKSVSDPWTESDGITYVADNFETTPRMSTYLLAFSINDFVYSSIKHRDIEIRAYTRRDSFNYTQHALDTAKTFLDYYEKYFETKYSLPKLDLLAVPGRGRGAMENWGLIIFGEEALLYKPGITSNAARKETTLTIAHELAHMWFGDLVSPAWWNDLWLNEAFAEFLCMISADSIQPELKVLDDFVVTEVQVALKSDSVVTSHPISGKVRNPGTSSLFDDITYNKGASVLRMLRHFMGAETFRKGLVRYIHKHKFQSAIRDDLWNAMEEQTVAEKKTIKVKEVMDTWLTQMNYPVVTVSRDDNDVNSFMVKQSRFLSNPSAKDPKKFTSSYGYKWTIPITLTSSRNPDFSENDTNILWMHHNETEKSFSVKKNTLPLRSDSNGWILVNKNQFGFYRVNYQRHNWNALIGQLNKDHNVLSEISRGQIINDALSLATAGLLDMDIAMETMEYLDKEYNSLPWSSAESKVDQIDSLMAKTPIHSLFQHFVREKVERPFLHYGLNYTSASLLGTEARKVIAGIACKFGVKTCVNEAVKLYQAWMENPVNYQLNPNLKSTILCTAIRHGGRKEWDFALKMFKESNFGDEKETYMKALACTENNWILNHFVNLLLDPSMDLNFQQVSTILSDLSNHPWSRMHAWKFTLEHLDFLKTKFSVNSYYLSFTVHNIIDEFNTESELSQVKDFIKSQKENLDLRMEVMEKSLREIQDNIDWMKTNYPKINEWLTTKYHGQNRQYKVRSHQI